MLTAKDFYTNYDTIIPLICRPYNKFLEIGSAAVPKDVRSICDLGIGTGNFSVAIRKLSPNIIIHGIDRNEDFLRIANNKIHGLKIYKRDLFESEFPKVGYIVSSLTTHHFDSKTRKDKLAKIASRANGFINFDMALFDTYNLDDAIEKIIWFAKHSYSGRELEEIARVTKESDNPMSLEEQRELFESMGLKFEVLVMDFPFAVYHTFWPNRK